MTLADMTDKQIVRIAYRLWARIDDYFGYQPYGIDWPTLVATMPAMARTLKAVYAEGRRRGIKTT